MTATIELFRHHRLMMIGLLAKAIVSTPLVHLIGHRYSLIDHLLQAERYYERRRWLEPGCHRLIV